MHIDTLTNRLVLFSRRFTDKHLDSAISCATLAGWTVHRVSLAGAASKGEAQMRIAKTLSLPEWFAPSHDALAECMSMACDFAECHKLMVVIDFNQADPGVDFFGLMGSFCYAIEVFSSSAAKRRLGITPDAEYTETSDFDDGIMSILVCNHDEIAPQFVRMWDNCMFIDPLRELPE